MKIALLFTPTFDLTPYIQRLSQFGQVDLILPKRRVSGYDLVVIPDKISIYPGVQALVNPITKGYYIPARPMCPYGELFRIDELENCKVPIMGIGDGRLMLWNMLGQKIQVQSGGEFMLVALDSINEAIHFTSDDRYGKNVVTSFDVVEGSLEDGIRIYGFPTIDSIGFGAALMSLKVDIHSIINGTNEPPDYAEVIF